jgi:teichuronic acid biosynthesis glycosyltransferase TuaG
MTEFIPQFADVSVVMPALNAANTIERALMSIACQTLKPREVIVVDDGSSDQTIAVVESCRGAMNGIPLRLYAQPHLGPGAARNRAIHAAVGRYLAFLDADDLWLPAKLERSLATLEQGGFTMVAHDIIEISTRGSHRIDCRSRWLSDPARPLKTLYLRGYISSSTVVLRREDVLAVGGFDSTLPSAQDYDLWLAVLSLPTTRFALFGEALLQYSLFDGGITGRTEQRRQCNDRILRTHIPALRREAGAVLPLVALRALIVQREALQAHWQRRRFGRTLYCLVLTPVVLLRALVAIPFPRPRQRDFISGLPPAMEIAG